MRNFGVWIDSGTVLNCEIAQELCPSLFNVEPENGGTTLIDPHSNELADYGPRGWVPVPSEILPGLYEVIVDQPDDGNNIHLFSLEQPGSGRDIAVSEVRAVVRARASMAEQELQRQEMISRLANV